MDKEMYELINRIIKDNHWKYQLPIFLAAFLIAEFFYKFKSFALECIAFLITWYAFDAIFHFIFDRKPTASQK